MTRTISPDSLARLRAAERRANWRDWDNRYGTHRRAPYGLVTRRWPEQPSFLADFAVLFVLALCGAVAYIALAA